MCLSLTLNTQFLRRSRLSALPPKHILNPTIFLHLHCDYNSSEPPPSSILCIIVKVSQMVSVSTLASMHSLNDVLKIEVKLYSSHGYNP